VVSNLEANARGWCDPANLLLQNVTNPRGVVSHATCMWRLGSSRFFSNIEDDGRHHRSTNGT
jgi:hypothetical protein